MKSRRSFRLPALLTLCALVLVLPATASAGVKKGTYECSYDSGGTTFFAPEIKIKSSSKYTTDGDKGKYSYKSKSKRINFKSGAYKGSYGIYSRSGPTIAVYQKDGTFSWTCS